MKIKISMKTSGRLNALNFFALNDDETDIFWYMAAAGSLAILLLFQIIF